MKTRLVGRHFVYSSPKRDALQNILFILAPHAAGMKTQTVGCHFAYSSATRDTLQNILVMRAPHATAGMKTQR